jgi:hypothetical protein
MSTLAQKIISFNKRLDFKGVLPAGINIMNPFKEDKAVIKIMQEFYTKYYNDNKERYFIVGINPGRFGGAVTGIPFTDPKRLVSECHIAFSGKITHEPSSVFVYDVINAFGGPEKFYSQFYIHSIFPLGFTAPGKNGKAVNYNYYDKPELTAAVYDAIVANIRTQLKFGLSTTTCFCLGTGKNELFLRKLNEKFKFFKEVVALEHPRFVMQYKAKHKQQYIDKYLTAFDKVTST